MVNFGNGTSRSGQFGFPFMVPATSGDFLDANRVLMLTPNRANKPLYIKDDYGGVADYTGGNAANTLIVSVAYMTLDAATGVFE